MRRSTLIILWLAFCGAAAFSQSGRVAGYSESLPKRSNSFPAVERTPAKSQDTGEDEVVRIDTDLVMIPVRVSQKNGTPVANVKKEEFRIFENGIEQEIAYFSDDEQPFTVALMLDMSYSSVFKLDEIHAAAMAFVRQLRPHDRVMIVSFDEKPRILCEPTSDRKVLRYAIEAARIGSGTGLYTTLKLVIDERLANVPGRKAVVLLSDGVDTSSIDATAEDVLKVAEPSGVIVYPIQYNTYDDVQKSRRNNAQVLFDEDDRPYVVDAPQSKGERMEDYRRADDFLREMSERTGGRRFRVGTTSNLNLAFERIANELRKIYSLGYYPSSERVPDFDYSVNVRVYRPDLLIRARDSYRSGKR